MQKKKRQKGNVRAQLKRPAKSYKFTDYNKWNKTRKNNNETKLNLPLLKSTIPKPKKSWSDTVTASKHLHVGLKLTPFVFPKRGLEHQQNKKTNKTI